MPASNKSSKSGGAKKQQVKVADLKPSKDAKGGVARRSKGGLAPKKNAF